MHGAMPPMRISDAPHKERRLCSPPQRAARARGLTAGLALAAIGTLGACASTGGQEPNSSPIVARSDSGTLLLAPMLTRSDLQALESRLDSLSRSAPDKGDRSRAEADAEAAKRRLELGDFQTGDRFFLAISGGVIESDTVTVLNGPAIQIKNVGLVPLKGVLRSELQSYLGRQVLLYVKSAIVTAQPLISVALLGAIAKPGFYSFPADLSLADAIMRAGGPVTGTTDFDKTVIHRGKVVVVDARGVQAALSQGMSFDRLNLRSGDSIDFGQKSNLSYLAVLQTAAGIISILALAYYGFRRR
jgi:protein involved in polysaccharide export with SLBB domain